MNVNYRVSAINRAVTLRFDCISNHLDKQMTCIRKGLSDVHDIVIAEISIHVLQL